MLFDRDARSKPFSAALARIAMPQLAEADACRTAVKWSADDGGDGAIVDEQEPRVRATAPIEPGFVFETWVENRSADFRKRNSEAGL